MRLPTCAILAMLLAPAVSVSSPVQQHRSQPKQTVVTAKSAGQTLLVNGTAYYIRGKPESTFAVDVEAHGVDLPTSAFIPVTLFSTSSPELSVSEYKATIERFNSTDDVWSSSFQELVMIKSDPLNDCVLEDTLASMLQTEGTSAISSLQLSTSLHSLSEGPYFLLTYMNSCSIYKAYRLYSDYSAAFFYGVIDDQEGGFEVLSATHPATDGATTIAVPSRLYYAAPTAELPLSGVRIGVKDLYDLKGLKTSMGNRAWFHLYDSVNSTAVAIQRLIDLGGVIIGKTRLSQFANGESATIDWVDYHDPFNPRGDGYQDPSSSSSGAGSAEASYDWIDMNIGSDTGGSIRAPAGVSGVFGNRPSQGAISLTGALSLSPEMDTAAFVARRAQDFATWGKAWYGGNPIFKSYPSFPTKIIYPIDTPGINATLYPSPGFFPSSYNESQPLYDTFVAKLEAFLGVNKTEFDFYTEYRATSGTSLYPPDHVGEVWTKLTCYDQARQVFQPFFRDFAAAHDGDQPYLDPPVKRNHAYGLNQTDADRARITASKAVFTAWVRSHLVAANHTSVRCSDTLVVSPLVPGAPASREAVYDVAAPTDQDVYLGWNRYGIAQLAGVPEVVIPLGAVPFASPVSGTPKLNPVAVSLLAGYGCDFMLFDLVAALARARVIPEAVQTGANL
ncbi:MAG: hypothetical protein M1818_001026 [Claussenomyces sp. TS43310]|nr:MAG: hypothetical protein M1818_001026 [Claussenomyces sp. TS43310]